ncbi:MAG: hypothetical protein ACRYG8_23300 [Janthinobacterium lividum]
MPFRTAMASALGCRPAPPGALQMRDRGVPAFGMAGGFRRSALVALQVVPITGEPRGLWMHFGRTRTDQDGSGQVIAIPNGRGIRPAQLLETWLVQAGISEGLVFRRLKGGAATDGPMSGSDGGTGGAGTHSCGWI